MHTMKEVSMNKKMIICPQILEVQIMKKIIIITATTLTPNH